MALLERKKKKRKDVPFLLIHQTTNKKGVGVYGR